MSLTYAGDLRCDVAHEPSSTKIGTDAPVDNMGKGERFSPTDLVGAALLSCAVTTMAIKAPREGIELPAGSMRGRVRKEMSAAPPRKIAGLSLTLELPAALSPPQRARLEEIARTCPVALSLGDVDVSMTFTYGERP